MSLAAFTRLGVLSQISYSAIDSFVLLKSLSKRTQLHTQLHIKSRQIMPLICGTPLSDSSTLPETFRDDIVQEMGAQAIADPILVNRSIERRENIECLCGVVCNG